MPSSSSSVEPSQLSPGKSKVHTRMHKSFFFKSLPNSCLIECNNMYSIQFTVEECYKYRIIYMMIGLCFYNNNNNNVRFSNDT